MKAKKNDTGKLNVRLSKDFLKRLKLECVRREMTLQAATHEALETWLRRPQGGQR